MGVDARPRATAATLRRVDGDVNTRWAAAAARTPGQWLTVDLGEAQTFDRLTLDAERDTSGQPYGSTIVVSRDGTYYGGPLARVSGRWFTQDAVFPAHPARYVRIGLTACGPAPWVVNDLRPYGDGPDASAALRAEQVFSYPASERRLVAKGGPGAAAPDPPTARP
ncbi:discoidin domain-containing protein [Streptomyces sp. 7R007]